MREATIATITSLWKILLKKSAGLIKASLFSSEIQMLNSRIYPNSKKSALIFIRRILHSPVKQIIELEVMLKNLVRIYN